MVSSDKVSAHISRIDASVAQLESRVSRIADSIIDDITSHLVKNLSIGKGEIRQSHNNAGRILGVGDMFERLLDASDYQPTVLAFISGMSDQVDEFANFYGEMSHDAELPRMRLTSGDYDTLAGQAEAAAAVLGNCQLDAVSELRQTLSRSLGVLDVAQLVKGTSTAVRRMTRVGPLAKDQCLIFFRITGSLIYRNVEATGETPLYSYVGDTTKNSREFCSALSGSGKKYTSKEIVAMDNGQTPDAMVNAGGHRCSHWWAIVEVS